MPGTGSMLNEKLLADDAVDDDVPSLMDDTPVSTAATVVQHSIPPPTATEQHMPPPTASASSQPASSSATFPTSAAVSEVLSPTATSNTALFPFNPAALAAAASNPQMARMNAAMMARMQQLNQNNTRAQPGQPAAMSAEEEERLFRSLPAKIQQDITSQMAALPQPMRATMRQTMITQTAKWRDNPAEALLFATKKSQMNLVKMVVEELGAVIGREKDGEGNTALHWAVWYKDIPVAEYLIQRIMLQSAAERETAVEARNGMEQTPLHWACMGGDVRCVRLMVSQAKARVAVKDKDGYYPVHAAAQHGNAATLDYLQLMGADIRVVDAMNRTPLHWSAFKGEVITTQWLLQEGLDLAVVDTVGRTALHWAASQNNVEHTASAHLVHRFDSTTSAATCAEGQRRLHPTNTRTPQTSQLRHPVPHLHPSSLHLHLLALVAARLLPARHQHQTHQRRRPGQKAAALPPGSTSSS